MYITKKQKTKFQVYKYIFRYKSLNYDIPSTCIKNVVRTRTF